jgi:hypothetical protein
MPCHPDRVRLNYDETDADALARHAGLVFSNHVVAVSIACACALEQQLPAWRSHADNDAEQLERRAQDGPDWEERCSVCRQLATEGGYVDAHFICVPCATRMGFTRAQDTGITANVIEGDPLEPDSDHLWGV